MFRCYGLLGVLILTTAGQPLRADAFDRYVNPVLAKVPGAEGVKELKQLTPDLIADHDRVIAGATGALVVVKTNEGRYSKLLVQAARQRVRSTTIPVLLIDRYVTYREGQERTTQATGKNLILFPDFHLSLDIGQVVPASLEGDLHFVAEGDKVYLEPLGKTRLFLVTKPLAEAAPKKSARVVVGATFEPRYFNGSYKLHDDGRRSGTLTLQVADDGEVTGSYYSDKDGQKYDVKGKVGTPRHSIQFAVKFPRSEEVFQGWLFTGDGKALTGTSRLQEREAGFYATRVEDE
jgi:hypothetical protein